MMKIVPQKLKQEQEMKELYFLPLVLKFQTVKKISQELKIPVFLPSLSNQTKLFRIPEYIRT